MKVKHRETFEVLIGAVVGPASAPRAVVAGQYHDGELVIVGRSTELTAEQSQQLAPLLTPTDDHPWPTTIASHGWGQGSSRTP